jgi:hypothetical protein
MYIFFSIIQQNVIEQSSRTKISKYKNIIELMVMSQFYKTSLIKMLNFFLNMNKLPLTFQKLWLCFKLQLCFWNMPFKMQVQNLMHFLLR